MATIVPAVSTVAVVSAISTAPSVSVVAAVSAGSAVPAISASGTGDSSQAFTSTAHRTIAGGMRWDTMDDIRIRRAWEEWIADHPYTINVSLTFAPRPFDDLRYLEPGDLKARRWRSRQHRPDLTRTPRKIIDGLSVPQIRRLIERFCRRLGGRTRQSVRAIVAVEPHVNGGLHAHGQMAGAHLSPSDVLEAWPYGMEAEAQWLGEGHTTSRGVGYNMKHVGAGDDQDSSSRVLIFGGRWNRPDYHACLEIVREHDRPRAEGLPSWDDRCARSRSR